MRSNQRVCERYTTQCYGRVNGTVWEICTRMIGVVTSESEYFARGGKVSYYEQYENPQYSEFSVATSHFFYVLEVNNIVDEWFGKCIEVFRVVRAWNKCAVQGICCIKAMPKFKIENR